MPVLAFVGALTPGKRPQRFVEVVAALRRRGVELRAVVCGDGPLAPSLAGPAAAAGVELLGSRSDVAEVLRGADVFVFPSLPTGEGMPGVLIEAGLTGLPVVATAVPGVRTIVEDGTSGFVVDVDDLDAMVEATARLLLWPGPASDHGRRGARGAVWSGSASTPSPRAGCRSSTPSWPRGVRPRRGRSAPGTRRVPEA